MMCRCRKEEMRKAKGGKVWIQGAISQPGSLHRELHIPQGKKIPRKTLEKAAHSSNPLLKKRAVLAETLKRFSRHKGRR